MVRGWVRPDVYTINRTEYRVVGHGSGEGGVSGFRAAERWWIVWDFVERFGSALRPWEESGLNGSRCAIWDMTVPTIEALGKTPYCCSGILMA